MFLSLGITPGRPALVNEYDNSSQSNVQRNLNNLQEFNGNLPGSNKQTELPKNGYITPGRDKLESTQAEFSNHANNVSDERHYHASKKHKKSKKHKFNENDDNMEGGIQVQPNALAAENISVVDSSESFLRRNEKQVIPKMILSRNAEDLNKFIVKENSTNWENSLKRRRLASEEGGQKLPDSKRSKNEMGINDGLPVLIPSIPIKLDRRLSARSEDVFGE